MQSLSLQKKCSSHLSLQNFKLKWDPTTYPFIWLELNKTDNYPIVPKDAQ